MNNRNRHMQYRKSIYRRRRIRAIIICTVLAIAVAFALFMIVGTALHNKTQRDDGDPVRPTGKNTEETLASAARVGCYPLPLLEDGSSFSSRLSSVDEAASAVCINLNDRSGTLLYRSDLAASFPHLSVHKDAGELSSSLASIERSGYYVSAVLYVNSFSASSDLVTDVELATWGSVACEAIREGVGDVLIVAQSMKASDVERICALADKIHSTVSNGVIGLAIPESILAEEKSATLIDKLASHFNYLSLDATSLRDGDDPISFIEGKISSLQLELMYYKMRVLLPRAEDAAEQKDYVDTVTKYNISSFQILP